MDLKLLLTYLGALVIGMVLGLIGGGGSILTVPILVYGMAINPITATAYSLFVVGTSALVGTLKNLKTGLINYKIGLLYALPALIAVFFTRMFIIPALPKIIFIIEGFKLSKHSAIMILFAVVMFSAAYSMIKGGVNSINNTAFAEIKVYKLVLQGIIIGIISGLVGAGGGFLIIPALVLLAGLTIKQAVATSLFIISINSLFGFLGDVTYLTIDWLFLISFSVVSIIGVFIGVYASKIISAKHLRKIFGWFILLMSAYILYKEIFKII